MRKTAKLLRNSLILLTLGAAGPVAWAASTPEPKSHFAVPIQSADTPPTPRIMDLKAPDIRDVMTQDEMAAALAPTDELEVIGPDAVAVHGATPAPYVPAGFGALYWAALHPMSAWRILAPVQ
jgi:hypothetical protein